MSEDQYKRIADEYLREYGAGLRRELEDLERRPFMHDTRILDSRVRRGIAALNRPRYIRYTGLIAACLVIALVTTIVLRGYPGRNSAPGADMPYQAASPAAPSASQIAPPPSLPGAAPPAPSSTYEILPLSFNMPSRFTVASVEQDVGKTVYRLTDSKMDDVVMTLERSGDISQYDTLIELSIGGRSAFGSSGNGYSLLAFEDEHSDILYVLTCRYDINTLVLLGESILI